MTTARRPAAPLVTGLGALIAVTLALPLLAPSCSDFQPGVKSFAKGSLIIPMDVCYQYQTDQVRSSYTPSSSCPSAQVDRGDVIKAYGLVYQLIRNGVAVYWIINPDKGSVTPAQAALTTPDLSLQYNAGFPVLKYDWSGAAPSVAPNTANHTIKYLGGPFVIDGSDAVRAREVLQAYRSTFGAAQVINGIQTYPVNVHVSNIAFSANVAKMLAGGWNAGGTVPPKLALLNIGSSGAGSKNSEVVISGYLAMAGIGDAVAGGDARGTHGTIYDRLDMLDFQPDASGNWQTSNLYKNGYQILWVPHWAAPSSCSDCPPGTSCPCTVKYSTTNPTYIPNALRTIGAFGAAGKDIFAECAGLGSFEGVLNDATYGPAVAETHFQTVVPSPLVGAFSINTSTTATPVYQPGNFASPLMQLGDYPFIPRTGAIQNYKPAGASTPYLTGGTDATVRLISETNGGGAYDIFTHRPGLKSGHGAFVYLGGHSYSGTDGSFEVGGTRLVLNTLFNLGAGCTESGVACDTGVPGVCAKGVFKCDVTGKTYCAQTVLPAARETCNGLDDDCNGVIDDAVIDPATCTNPSDLTTCQYVAPTCYTGPAGTRNVGTCHDGTNSCVKDANGAWGLTGCVGQATPQPEECNGLDDDCNGQVDEALTRSCYDGDVTTLDPGGTPRGACKAGRETCSAGSWGACRVCSSAEAQQATPPADCQILPRADDCTCAECGSGGKDWNCDGQVQQCSACTSGTTQPCYTGPSGTAGVGECRAGTQTCVAGNWSTCGGTQVVPVPEVCGNLKDDNCNGSVDEASACGECAAGAERACYTGQPLPGNPPIVFYDPVPGSPGHASVCKRGTERCGTDLKWGACGSGSVQQTLPGAELCNGLDDDCDGAVDDGAQCGPGFACRNGVCVYDACGPEIPCAEGYACVGGTCQLTTCGGVTCPAGSACSNGSCVNPNAGLNCGAGSSPAGGFCTGGACYEAGCAAGQVCRGGACVADPCAGVACPGGSFCRQGDCVQACAFIACGAGQRCDEDGFCVADTCAGKSCGPTQTCVGGSCVADPCAGVSCGRGQACQAGACVDDPCAGVTCPAGQCQSGQCYSTGSTAGELPHAESGGCGCATGGAGTSLALLALLALAPLARRRRRLPGGAALLGLLLLAVAATGCQKDTPFDPASCTGIAATVTSCAGEDRCVDVAFDPSHCGACDLACRAGETCVDSGCFPASSVAPFIAAVSPVTLDRGGFQPVRVSFTGERFDAGATVRATHAGGTTTYAANVIDAGHLSALVDLKDAQPDTWKFRVVNGSRVISNSRLVPVQVPRPALTGVTPSSAEVGAPLTLRVAGSGLMVDSLCFFGPTTGQGQALPATLTASGLDCQLDLSAYQPGPYLVWVANPVGSGAPVLSNQLPFSATSNAAPTLVSLSPSAAKKGSVKPLTVNGTGFDVTSKVYLVVTIPPAAAVEVPQVAAFVSANQLQVGALDLTLCPGPTSPCPSTGEGTAPGASYAVKVRSGPTGSVQTASLPFTIATNPPEISTLVPAFGYQGEVKSVVVQGSAIPAGSIVQFGPSGGTFADVPTTAVTATSATGTFDLRGSPPGSVAAGAYQARLKLPAGAGFSASLPFSVTSNTAILQSVSPASGAQGANPVVVTFNVANLQPSQGSPQVVFSAQPNAVIAASGTTSPFTASLDLRGVPSGLQTLQVRNPNGAALSNPANFTVTPGSPTLAGVSPASAALQAARVPVVLTGTNFAAPDSAGANGSSVHVFANCTPVIASGQVTGCTCACTTPADCLARPCIPDQVLDPAYNTVTVTSPTRIDVQFDTTSAVPATYSIWVWNPGGSPWQRSNQLPNAFTVSP